MNSVASNEGGNHNLDLNLAIATPSYDGSPSENKGHLQFRSDLYDMHAGISLGMGKIIDSGICDSSLKRLVVNEKRPSIWNGMHPSFIQNEERARRITVDPSQGLSNCIVKRLARSPPPQYKCRQHISILLPDVVLAGTTVAFLSIP